jgi:ankyrin repeat protein
MKAGQTSLHLACSHGNEEMISLLLKKGADINSIENVWSHQVPILLLLIKVGLVWLDSTSLCMLEWF